MDQAELKALYKKTFNAVSEGYGHSAMRVFSESAGRIPSYLDLKGDEHVLDVATGTGYAALAIARKLPDGKVTGIDFSSGMLTQARKNSQAQGISNVDFREMDMEAIDYPKAHFDAAVSAFSIFFVDNMRKQLIHMAEKVKTGGAVLTTTFSENAFTPLATLFLDRIEHYGIEVPSPTWKHVASREQCTSLFNSAGLQTVKCEQKPCGYYLKDVSDWWYIVWNGGFRGLVNQLSADDFGKFKHEHLAEVDELKSDKGIWLEMNVLYTVSAIGEK